MTLTLKQWLHERYDNCVRIAAQKTGQEKEGWLEDAHYFSLAIKASNSIQSELSRLNTQWQLDDYPDGVEPQNATEANFIYCALRKLEKGLK